MPRYEVEFREMNSGGYYIMDSTDWDALRTLGWEPYGSYGASKVFTAPNEHIAEEMAWDEIDGVTDARRDDAWCNCCGPRYSMYAATYTGPDSNELRTAIEEARENGLTNEDIIRIVLED